MTDRKVLIANIIDNLRRVFHVLHEQSRKIEKKTGLTGPQVWVIKTISETGPLSVSELANKIYLHPSTVVGILDRLEAKDLIKRVRSKNDRRVVRVELSSEGEALVSRAPEVAQGLLVVGLEPLAIEKLEVVADGLEYLVDILRAQGIPPQLILSPEINLPPKNIVSE